MFDFGRKHLAAGLVAGTAMVGVERADAATFTEQITSGDYLVATPSSPTVELPFALSHTYYGATSFSIDSGEGGADIYNPTHNNSESASATLTLVASLNGSSTVLYSLPLAFSAPTNSDPGVNFAGFSTSFAPVDFDAIKFVLTVNPGSGADTNGELDYEPYSDSQLVIEATAIPEPASLSLLGVAGLALMRRRR